MIYFFHHYELPVIMQQAHLQQILLRSRQQQAEQQLNPNQPGTANSTNPVPPAPTAGTGIAAIDPLLLTVPVPTQNNDNNNNQNLLLNHRWDNYYINQRMPVLRNRALNLAINLRNFLADNVFGVGIVNNNNNNNGNVNVAHRRVRMINLRNLQQINLGSIQIIPTVTVQPIEELAAGIVDESTAEQPSGVDIPIVTSNETLMDDRSNFQRNFEENNFMFSSGENSVNNEENDAADGGGAAPGTIESKSTDESNNKNLYYSVAPVAQKELNAVTSETKSKINLNVVVDGDGDSVIGTPINEEFNKTIIKTTIDKIKFDECSSKEMNSSLNDNWGNCNSSIEGNSCRAIVQDEHKISIENNKISSEDPGDEN